ncbi:PHa [Pseudomonas phage phi8]|uniref:PHa n=1 Tax=Pseudomonas phage phi8 TaxID=120086 RepID=B4DCT9_9VIRU|nr:PHa [Pseudomonas phage phi8]ACG69468.1 PHa [Pseudomonas phage phi8]
MSQNHPWVHMIEHFANIRGKKERATAPRTARTSLESLDAAIAQSSVTEVAEGLGVSTRSLNATMRSARTHLAEMNQ